MKVCLLSPPSPGGYIRSGRWAAKSKAKQSWYPIWLGYATALLEREGHTCLLLDACTEGLNTTETTKKITMFNPDLIAFYFGYSTLAEDLKYAENLAKKYSVIFVGPWSFCLPNVLDNTSSVNLMTYGEFEHTLAEVANKKSLSSIRGLIWKNEANEVIRNPKRPLCSGEELDRIPFVTKIYKKFLDFENYHQTSMRYPFIDLLSARSCPYHCTYCLWVRALQHMDPGRYRQRSIGNVVEELWWIKNNIPKVKQIWFQDDTLIKTRAIEISQAILDEGLDICWGGYSRANLDYETLRLMKDSGLRTLHVGYESGDPETLRLIKKGVSIEQMEEFARHIQKLDLYVCAGFMIFPWESKESVRKTIMWSKKKIKSKRFSFTRLYAYPNTPICKTIESFRIQGAKFLTEDEMTRLEKEGFIENYLKNPSWIWDTLKHPREWRNVVYDARGLLSFLWK